MSSDLQKLKAVALFPAPPSLSLILQCEQSRISGRAPTNQTLSSGHVVDVTNFLPWLLFWYADCSLSPLFRLWNNGN